MRDDNQRGKIEWIFGEGGALWDDRRWGVEAGFGGFAGCGFLVEGCGWGGLTTRVRTGRGDGALGFDAATAGCVLVGGKVRGEDGLVDLDCDAHWRDLLSAAG